MRVLYGFSDILRFFLYKVIGYRVEVIRGNLTRSFPEKSKSQIKEIEREFYKHLCDLIVESIKFFTISESKAKSMMSLNNTEILHKLYDEGKDVILVGGHYGCWELYALNAPFHSKHRFLALYTALSSKWFDKKMKASRGRFGLGMHSTKHLTGFFDDDGGTPRAYIFGADQSPSNPEKAYWMTFLNQPTGVQFGAEKIAKEHNMAVVYGELDKSNRGKYIMNYRLISEDASKTEYGEITKTHTRWLEEKIQSKPQYWLWSHKRWKHRLPDGMELNDSRATA